jgi:hypothetical protein
MVVVVRMVIPAVMIPAVVHPPNVVMPPLTLMATVWLRLGRIKTCKTAEQQTSRKKYDVFHLDLTSVS